MEISTLTVLHQKKGQAQQCTLGPGFLKFETCLRSIWISQHFTPSSPLETLQGMEAYEFLLTWACGLQSEITGETDVFGQIKSQWEDQSKDRPGWSSFFQMLFEDTKEIRSQHMQNIGGSSYGSLARMLLQPEKAQDVLMIGAGALAESIAPYFLEQPLSIWNRSHEKSRTLWERLHFQHKKNRRVRLLDDSEEVAAWKTADLILVCIPSFESFDIERIDLIQKRDSTPQVLHLGLRRQDAKNWNTLDHFFCLDDLFELEQKKKKSRDSRILRAQFACRERSKLRLLGRSLSTPHGWEDLLVFNS